MLAALREWTRVCPLWLPDKPATAPAAVILGRKIPAIAPPKALAALARCAPLPMLEALAYELQTHRTQGRPGKLILTVNIPAGGQIVDDWHLQPAAIVGRWGRPVQARGLTATRP